MNAAVEEALVEAAYGLEQGEDGSLHGLDFDMFSRLVGVASSDELSNLDAYDARLAPAREGGADYRDGGHSLDTVMEGDGAGPS